ncbi:MAG TPA: 2-hydroxyacid dehydrogenase [Solirubrobacteraceae bacterium]|nr:2-hydroxyacid dehydrogenase [Solirubrobacteraceae bacterium]
MVTACLPTAEAVSLLGPMPDAGVLAWDGTTTAPAGIELTEFLVLNHGSPYAEVMAAMPRLRVVQALSAGIDYLLGLIPAGVTLCDGRGIHGGPVSELILAGILASLRQLPGFVRAQDLGQWSQHRTGELAGKRVLVVGAGDLGEQTARRLRAFDAEPVMVGRSARQGVHASGELPALLPAADIVVLVVPITGETRHMVDADFLARMRDGALLVNAARGPVVVTEALLVELESGRLQAVLDVTDPEPLPPNHPLWLAPNLLLTPHVGSAVPSYQPRAYALVRDQIGRYARREPLLNVVTGAY